MQAQNLANGTERFTDWNSIDWKNANRQVRNLRQRIFRATREEDWKKVQSLQKLMLRSYSNAQISVRRVTQINQGKNTPGVDKLVIKTPTERGKLVDEIISFTPWRAKPVRRVYIPKANGKQRPLGIPVIKDRAIQAMVKNALEPTWEARFEATSYGFRPGRSCQDAIFKIYQHIRPHKTTKWIVDADILAAFDNIDHEFLLKTIGQVPGRELIHQWLKAGYVDKNVFHETESGTPQGGVISPLLANIALHGMEKALGMRYVSNGKGKPRKNIGKRGVVRYADDFVVLCKTKEDAETSMQILKEWLAIRGLTLSPEKTRIVHISQGFDFLGFNLRQYKSKKTRTGWKTLIRPSKKSVQKIRERLREEWLSLNGRNVLTVIQRLNPIIRGWANYYRTQVAKRTFSNLDHYMVRREIRYVKRGHPTKPKYWWKSKYFGKLNPSKKDTWVFGDKKTGVYLLRFAWFKIERHKLVFGSASPDDPSLKEYWRKRELAKMRNLQPNLRRLALRQAGVCPHCGQSLFIEEDIEKHHIMARRIGGPDTDENKVLLHYLCHQQITVHQRKHGYDAGC